jgi:superfamily I DNA/RNA helicase
MTFPPTPEQQAIITAATDTEDNLLVSALAGAAKTSTLELLAKALPKTQMLCLAFNKMIATEMKERLPDNCRVQTLNSLGLSIWKDTCRSRVNVDTGKMYRLLTAALERCDASERSAAYDSFAMLLKEARWAKSAGHIPDSRMSKAPDCKTNPVRLMTDAELVAKTEDELTALQEGLLISILEDSLDEGLAGRIDFDDMLLLPTVYRASFPRVSLVLIDEAQDLSPMNHVMLAKLARKRIIAVGDQCQAIYGFRGASSTGMADLKHLFNMEEFPLTTSFRCPSNIVEHVRNRAPKMSSWADNPNNPGSVEHISTWSVQDIPDSAAVICRNNAPLFTLAVSLLRHGRFPNLWGNDITKGLIKILKKFGSTSMGQSALLQCIADWEDKKLKTARNPTQVQDRAECLRIFARQGETLAGAIGYAETLMDCDGPIQLMTGHKAKGHEFSHVYFLDSKLVGKDGQEPNLRYVICTRSMLNLTYINTSGCVELQPEEDEDSD